MTSKAFESVKAERARQLAKGYDAVHDDEDERGNHAWAAQFYAGCAARQRMDMFQKRPLGEAAVLALTLNECGYPWAHSSISVEPTARENLVKVAALAIAEIERIDRELAIAEIERIYRELETK